MPRKTRLARTLLIPCLAALIPIGCAAPPPDGGSDPDTGRNGPSAGTFTGAYDPAMELTIEANGIVLTVPAGASATPATMSVLPVREGFAWAPVPGEAGFTGARFGPDGTQFDPPAQVTVELSAVTILPVLPVWTYDEDRNRWIGTGRTAEVSANGGEATFSLDHFSTAGVPDPAPIPDPGDEIGSFVVVSGNGVFSSDAVSADTASLVFSEFGDQFKIDVLSQETGDDGQVDTKSLGLSAILVTRFDTCVIGVIGGGASLYNDGQFNEPVVGVMIMSLSGSTVNLAVYAATPERVISGTLTGPVQ